MAKASATLPKDPKVWVRLGLALVLVSLILLVGVATAMHLADDQFIGQDELKQNLQELESYSSEAGILSRSAQDKKALKAYTEAYASSLQKAVDSITQKLSEHAHSDSLDEQVNKTIEISASLSNQLSELSSEPTSQLSPDSSDSFKQAADNLKDLEQGL